MCLPSAPDDLHAVAALGDHVKGGAIKGDAIEGCGHFLPSECPDELVAAILTFWRETR
jgi:pimeloyl-ACP methyl ester carboxylesterase